LKKRRRKKAQKNIVLLLGIALVAVLFIIPLVALAPQLKPLNPYPYPPSPPSPSTVYFVSPFTVYFVGLVVGLVIEGLIVYASVKTSRVNKEISTTRFLASFLVTQSSYFILWYMMDWLIYLPFFITLTILEAFVVFWEAIFYRHLLSMSMKRAVATSFLANLASAMLGMSFLI